jgi:hypothetical protein
MSYAFKGKSDEQITKFLLGNHGQLESRRKQFEPLWELENKIFRPRRADFLGGPESDGKQYGAKIYDGYPQNVMLKFCVGFLSYLISRRTPFLQFVVEDNSLMDNDDVKKYLQACTEQITFGINKSSAFTALKQFMPDYATTGTAVIISEKDYKRDRISFVTRHPKRNYIADDRFGKPEVYHSPISITASMAIEMFGEDELPQEIIKASERNPFQKYDFIYCVYPNDGYVEGALDKNRQRYKEFYLYQGGSKESKIVYSGGRKSFPIIGRMGKDEECEYGMSLAADALTEALFSNKLGEKKLIAAHKAVEPPMLVHGELRGELHTGANGRTYTSDMASKIARPLIENINWPLAENEQELLHKSIDDKFYVRLFNLFAGREGPQITMYEAQRMIGEQASLLATVLDDFEPDVLDNMVDVVWDNETEAGRMPEAPDILFGDSGIADVKTKYTGRLAQLQRSITSQDSFVNALGILKEIAGIFGPQALMKVKVESFMEDLLIPIGVPQKDLLTDDEFAKVQSMAMAQQRQQEQAQMMLEGAKAVPSLQKTTEKGSPLEAITNAA